MTKHDTLSATAATRRRLAAAPLTVLLALAAAASAGAQGMPADAVLRDFEPNGDYVLTVDGKAVPAAQIYHSDLAPAFLIMTSAFPSPVLLMPREGTVTTVHIMKVAKQPDGTVDLLADAVLEPQGRFQAEDDRVSFQVGAKSATFEPKPPLLGQKNAAALRAYSPSYGRLAEAYRPNGQQIAALKRAARPIKVQVFFGSWCPFCKEYVPHILKVEEALKGTKVQFEYIGLPRDLKTPEAQRMKVKSVPTGIVFVNGKEAGRISGDGWKTPEAALVRIVAGA